MSEPRPYMTGREEVGHYKHAFAESLEQFRRRNPREMAVLSGTEYDPGHGVFTVPSFGRTIKVSYPAGRVTFGNGVLPLAGWRLVVLNYLGRAGGAPLTGQLITYRELEDGMVFYQAFQRESIIPLGKWVGGKSPGEIARAVAALGGVTREGADIAAVIPALPRFPVTLKMWFPDDELPGSANILFDATANNYLHTEDIAVVGGYTAAFLVKEYQVLTGKPWRELTL